MAYIFEVAEALTRTLTKFKTLNAYQLAGHAANLEFWKGQLKNAIDALDGYTARQRTSAIAEKTHIRAHDSRRFFPSQLSPQQLEEDREFPEDAWPLEHAKPDPQLISTAEIKEKRRLVVDAFYSFLLRCHKESLLSGDAAKQTLAECGVGVELGHFRDEDE